MASESDNYQTFGSFSVINGVMVKISDKFFPPTKVTLPSNWKDVDPSELLQFQYDFTKEKTAVSHAEEERLSHMRHLQQKEEEEQHRLKEEQHKQEEVARLQKQKEEEVEQQMKEDSIDCGEAEKRNLTKSVAKPTVVANIASTSDILTPFVVKNSNVNKPQQQSHTFDPLEFENQNDNPFESVERATLNELDELRSVLEPDINNSSTAANIRSVPEDNRESEDFELSSVFFHNPTQDDNTGHIISITDAISQSTQNQIYTNDGFDAVIPHGPSKGTLTWTQFDSSKPQPVINSFNPMNPFHPNYHSLEIDAQENKNNSIPLLSKTPPPNVSYMSTYTDSSVNSGHIENTDLNDYENAAPLHRAKSLPNLQEQNDYENAENISFVKYGTNMNFSVQFTKSQGSSPLLPQQQQQQQQQPVATDRVSNIMKQFQFQRMAPTSSPNQTVQTSNNMVTNINGMNQYDSPLSSTETNNPPVPSYTAPPLSNQYIPAASTSMNYVAPYNQNSQNFMNYQHPVSSQYQSGSSPYPISPPDYSGGPMLIQSQPIMPNSSLHMDQVSQPSGSSSDSVIHLNQSQGQINCSNFSSHNVLPPIINNSNVYSVPAFGSAATPIPYPPRQPVDNKILTTDPTIPPRRPQSAKLTDRDLKVSPAPPLPNIPSYSSYTPAPITSTLLPDLFNTLSTSEKNFANQLNAMGFPLPCVSRAVKRLGMDEKEVLDFLVLVEELKESTKQEGDDIEIALQYNDGDKTKVASYLEMVSTFKELGFQPKNIHEALKETSCDQNKALDHLTR